MQAFLLLPAVPSPTYSQEDQFQGARSIRVMARVGFYDVNCHGRDFAVSEQRPALWASRRLLRSAVRPVQKCAGCLSFTDVALLTAAHILLRASRIGGLSSLIHFTLTSPV